ncbi:MAG: SLBB domain-containing protein [candidate division NC10 bacterium]|nr:SLBB domain-containing protein [candidate division NC10 bacterium]
MRMRKIPGATCVFGSLVAVILTVVIFVGAAAAQQEDRSFLPLGDQFRTGQLPSTTQDRAGGASPPTITIVEPADGSVIPTKTPRISITFSDRGAGIDVRSFQVFVNGVDLTAAFTVTASGASYQVPVPGTAKTGPEASPQGRVAPIQQGRTPQAPLQDQELIREGQNVIAAVIKNKAGLVAAVSSSFVVDPRGAPAFPGGVKSPIEAAFLQPLPLPPILSKEVPPPPAPSLSRNLTQFGYDHFHAPASTFAPLTDVPVGPEYVLGPGDNLVIALEGLHENTFTLPISSSGEIRLPQVGSLPVWGLTFAQAQRVITKKLAQYLKGFQATITMGPLRTIHVSVVGELARPGRYTLSSLATVSNALYVAGGPTKLGSLREIRLLRNHEEVGGVDLYEFFIQGKGYRDYPLQSGDVIYVPPIGPTVAITGEVKRPAIYELKGPTRVKDLLAMAGGPLPTARLQRVQIERVEASTRRVILDVDLTQESGNIELQDGDLVKVPPLDPRVYNTVVLEGFVKDPGEYELKPGMRLRDLLPPDRVLPEAYLERVEIVRLREPDLTREVVAVNLKQLWMGDENQNVALQPLDRITVTSEHRGPATVTLQGEVKRLGRYTITPGERLSSVLRRAGGFTAKAFLKGAVFSRESVRWIEKEQLDEFVKLQEQRLLAQAGTVVVSGLDREAVAAEQQALAQRRELLHALADRVTLGRVVIRLQEPEMLEGTPDDIVLEDGDTLFVPTPPSTVVVIGSVRNPTSILYKPGQNLDYYFTRAGGLTSEADKKEIYLMKADGSAHVGFVKLREIEPGDSVIVPPKAAVKVRPLPVARDLLTILGQTLLSVAALVVIF